MRPPHDTPSQPDPSPATGESPPTFLTSPPAAELPNFARIVKDAKNNMRECLMKLETELIFA